MSVPRALGWGREAKLAGRARPTRSRASLRPPSLPQGEEPGDTGVRNSSKRQIWERSLGNQDFVVVVGFFTKD